MTTYIVRRLLAFIPVLLLVSMAIFLLMRVVPGDPAAVMLAGHEGRSDVPQEEYERLRSELGLDQPIHVQYAKWLSGLLQLDLGRSFVTNRAIADELSLRLPLTVELALLTVILALCVALPTGIWSALKQDTLADYVFRVIATAGMTMPTFWTGSLVIVGLVLVTGWIPPIGFSPIQEDIGRNFSQLIFPAIVLGYSYAAVVSRMTRSAVLEVVRQDYTRTAWAKGLRERVVVFRHILKNALLPVVTIAGLQFGHLLGGSVVVEAVFALPGIGTGLISAVQSRDLPVVQIFLVLIAFWFLLVNLLVDLLYGFFDPRIRFS